MKDSNDIDRLFNEKLSGFSSAPSPQAWKQLHSGLTQGGLPQTPKQGGKTFGTGWTWLLILPLILLSTASERLISQYQPLDSPAFTAAVPAKGTTTIAPLLPETTKAFAPKNNANKVAMEPVPATKLQPTIAKKNTEKEVDATTEPIDEKSERIAMEKPGATLPDTAIALPTDTNSLIPDNALATATPMVGKADSLSTDQQEQATSVKVVIDLRKTPTDSTTEKGAAPQKEKLTLGKFLRRLQAARERNY